MLKEQLLKEYKIPTKKLFCTAMFVIVFCLFVNIFGIISYVSCASELAAMENLTLWNLIKIDIERGYKGTTLKALEYFYKAFMCFLVCIIFTVPLCLTPYTRRKQKQFLSLINQLPDDI